MKKVIGFSGSPRVGHNTDNLVNKVLGGAKNKGAETKFYNIQKQNISGCVACMACRKDGICSIKDDMNDIIAEIKNADAVVFGSPVYMLQMTGQTKIFVDRLSPLIKGDFTSNLREGIKAQWVFTQGAEDPELFRTYFDHNESIFKMFGFLVEKTMVVGSTGGKGDLEKQEEAIKLAFETGEKLI